jgi:hypothetical protein
VAADEGDMDGSTRRIVLTVALVFLLWADASTIYQAITDIAYGEEFGALGMPNIGAGFAAILLPVICVLLWLTYRVWDALRDCWDAR